MMPCGYFGGAVSSEAGVATAGEATAQFAESIAYGAHLQ